MAAVVIIATLSVGCGDSGDSNTTGSTTTAPEAAETTAPTTTAGDRSTTATDADVLAAAGVTILSLDVAESGPHPMLTWTQVEGAARYTVVVRTEAGAPFWSWSGESPQIRFGGGESDELNQSAAVLEPVHVSVLAHDDTGAIVGFAPPLTVMP